MSNGENRQVSQLVEYLGQLTGGLAHEIRNPLSTLKVNLQLLAEDLREIGSEEDDRIRRSQLRIRRMQDEVNRLRDILDDFIQFMAHHQLDYKYLDVNQLIDQLVEFYEPQASAGRIRILKYYHPTPLVCRIDGDLIKQAMLNLFINAQQAMPDGGELIIRTSGDGESARIEVTDTGTGMPVEVMDKIFNVYFSAKKGGTGLGLAMTRRIVDEHKGTIEVHSEPGKGTCFIIHLPLAQMKTENKPE